MASEGPNSPATLVDDSSVGNRCTKCRLVKPIDDFYTRLNRKRKRQCQCKKCFREVRETYIKDGRAAAASRRHYYRSKKKDSHSVSAKARVGFLRYKYGLTSEEYDKLVQDQYGLCLICAEKPSGELKNLIIDHDHKTGMFRGLLCNRCNSGLGAFDDRPDLLFAAAAYLAVRDG